MQNKDQHSKKNPYFSLNTADLKLQEDKKNDCQQFLEKGGQTIFIYKANTISYQFNF